MTLTYGSICTGGGFADTGAQLAGLRPVWGIELDKRVASCAQRNHIDASIYALDCRDVDHTLLPRVDVLHASPPCPNFSRANQYGDETETDRAIAGAVNRALSVHTPQVFTLENVTEYASADSFKLIMAHLLDLDYFVEVFTLNAADFGVAQTRKRLYLVARAGGFLQATRLLPPKQPWIGWYDVVADIIDTLPETTLADWQLKHSRLPELVNNLRAQAYLIESRQANKRGDSLRASDEPATTVTTDSRPSHRLRALLVDGDNQRGQTRSPTTRTGDQPAMTLRDSRSTTHRAILDAGRIVAMTPRALARFMSIPDSYVLPERDSLACKIIGNGVACQAYARLLQSQL